MEFLNHLLTELQHIWQSISVTHRVLLYAVLEVGSILFLLGQRRPPLATLSWILAFLSLPVLSLVCYFLFGPRKLKRRNVRRELARTAPSRCPRRWPRATGCWPRRGWPPSAAARRRARCRGCRS